MIIAYTSKHIPFIWADIEPFIKRALDRGSVYTPESIYDGLRASYLQLWVWQEQGVECVLVTSIVSDYCLLLCLSGKNMENWLHVLPTIESWAKTEGCKSMRIQGRKGWSRLLGYEITGRDELSLHIMEKEL